MREGDVLRLLTLFPTLVLSKAEKDKVESLIRKAYKLALGLPVSTSTQKLHLGVYDTLD